MKFIYVNTPLREIIKKSEEGEVVYYSSTKTVNIKNGDFETICNSIINDTFPKYFQLLSLAYLNGRVNLYNSSEIISLLMNYTRGSEFLKLSEDKKNKLLNYEFSLAMLIDWEEEVDAMEHLDTLHKLRYL